MGSLFSTLDIARSGLQASQIQLNVAGHNVSNASVDGYSRQRAEQTTPLAISYSYGELGRGTVISEIKRIRDEYLDKIYRQELQTLGYSEVQAQYFELLEDALLETTDEAFGTRLNDFFDAMNDFANGVEEYSVREATVAEAVTLAQTLNQLANQYDDLRTNANEEIRNMIPEINSLADSIAEINIMIRDAELDGSSANDLRDERDRALDELAKLININYTERDDGQITVRIGSDVLVDETGAREIVANLAVPPNPERGDLVDVRFADNNELVEITDGELYGVLEIRDVVIPEIDARIDTLAATIIEQVNRIHSQGNGLINLSGTISSTNAVSDSTLALEDTVPQDDNGDPLFSIAAGSFDIVIYDDSTGNQVAGSPFTVSVDPATDSLDDLVAAINAAVTDPNFDPAVVNAGGTITLGTTSGYSFSFSNDTSGILTALGINGLFTGTDAQTISVSQHIQDEPGYLSSAYDLETLSTGDNEAALAICEIRNALVLDNNSSTLNDYYESTVAGLGVRSASNQTILATEQAFIDDLESRRLEESGVNLDEEVTLMMEYQRVYEACARVVTVANTMLDALLAMGT